MEIRKGFYFSFDAILALTVMSATLVMMLGMMDTNYSSMTQQGGQAENLKTDSRDTMSLASTQTFQVYNESFQNELVANSVMDSSDLDKTVLNGITYLWASGNFSYAEEAAERYFDPRTDGPYQIQIQEEDETFTLPRDTERPESTGFVTTASSLVSGHRLNASNQGYRARARVTNAEAERTDITPISPSGSIPEDVGFSIASFDTTQYVEVPSDWDMQDAELDLNFRTSDSFFGGGEVTVEVNGQEITDSTSLSSSGDNEYRRYQVLEELESGQNNSITVSTDSFIVTGSILNPGSRLRIDYNEEPSLGSEETVTERYPLKYVNAQFGSFFGDDVSGVFDVENFGIPQTASVQDAELVLNSEGVGTEESPTGWDVRSVLNGETVIEEEAFGGYERTVDITDEVENGNNLLQVYINHDGEDEFWGGSETVLNSEPGTPDHSYVEVTYTDQNEVGYGKYEASTAYEAGDLGSDSLQNPFQFSTEFEYDAISRINLFMAMFNPDQPQVQAGTSPSNLQNVYTSSGNTPTLVTINPDLFNPGEENYVEMSDPSDQAEFLPESLLEYSAFVEPRVGYGPVFDTQEAAQQDAVERLEARSGQFFNFENIEPSSVTIGGEQRLWGPSTVRLVRWEE